MKCQSGSSDAQARSRCLASLLLVALSTAVLTGCFEDETRSQDAAVTQLDPATGERVDRTHKSDRMVVAVRPEHVRPPAKASDSASRNTPNSEPLSKFFRGLNALKTGHRSAPVTILHLGDSHIAADRFAGSLRALFQERFGDAGRGMMMPGFPFPYYRARGVDFARSGKWTAANSFKKDPGPYGVTGVRLTAREKGAQLSLTGTAGPFEWAAVAFATSPKGGKAKVSFGGDEQTLSTRADKTRIKRVRFAVKGRELTVTTADKAPVSILSWSAGQNRPGVRYVNLGIPGASADTPDRWNEAMVDDDLAQLKPDLIVLGYGTNEGFQDDLDVASYEKRVADLVNRFKAHAPQASVLILGPPDGLRFPRYARPRNKRAAASAPCKPLSADERDRYEKLKKEKSRRLARWHAPPRLADVRAALRRIAQETRAHFWDWSSVMGGECGIHAWAKADPPLAASDRVHLRGRGAKRSAQALFDELMRNYEIHVRLASH
ncbi:MAG: GDSL-type esterase/lipase family protein [Hyphomicrobiaceae bacterium]|nr:GDSL-type esterase/lipase family protein [Hyphomicrobiaceae bacterium]